MKKCLHIDDKEKTCGYEPSERNICLWRRIDIIDDPICTKPKEKKEMKNGENKN